MIDVLLELGASKGRDCFRVAINSTEPSLGLVYLLIIETDHKTSDFQPIQGDFFRFSHNFTPYDFIVSGIHRSHGVKPQYSGFQPYMDLSGSLKKGAIFLNYF